MSIDLLKNTSDKVIKYLKKIIQEDPPTIGLIGTCGVGKSSTINAMFGTNLPTSPTIACTKNFIKNDFLAKTTQEHQLKLRVIDAPGLGEDIESDEKYLKEYKKELEKCDVILWIMTARNRATALDQVYLKNLLDFKDKITFGLNQVDLTDPLDWNNELNTPSKEQKKNIQEIVKDRKIRLEKTLNQEIAIIPYSAKTGYNLERLFVDLLKKSTKERKWLFSTIKNFKAEDFIPTLVENNI